MHRSRVFFASLIAMAAIVLVSLFGAIAQGPPGLAPATPEMGLLNHTSFAGTALVLGGIAVVGLGIALMSNVSSSDRLRRSNARSKLLSYMIPGLAGRFVERARVLFIQSHVHTSRMRLA